MLETFKNKNKWKLFFWILAILNIAVLLGMLLLTTLPPSYSENPGKQDNKERAEFTISSTKDNLNQVMNSYLNSLPNNKALDYSISLEDSVQLRGSIIAFEKKIPLTMTFKPIVQKNGDLVLEQESITLGRLHLPNRTVLQYVKNNYAMPEWVIVNPGKESIYVAATKMKTKSDFKVKVEKFDPKQDEFVFTISVPHEVMRFKK